MRAIVGSDSLIREKKMIRPSQKLNKIQLWSETVDKPEQPGCLISVCSLFQYAGLILSFSKGPEVQTFDPDFIRFSVHFKVPPTPKPQFAQHAHLSLFSPPHLPCSSPALPRAPGSSIPPSTLQRRRRPRNELERAPLSLISIRTRW